MPALALRRRTVAAALLGAALPFAARAAPLRVLHVMSYHADWQWNKDQLRGFQEGLGMPVDLKIVELDAKRRDAAGIAAAGREADALVAAWKPGLIYTNDDIAQSAFAVRHLDGAAPIVYSGLNREPSVYGFDQARNVTGALEHEHFPGTLALLREVAPLPAKLRLAIVLDDDPTWAGVAARLRGLAAGRADIASIDWLQPATLAEYQAQVAALQGKVDAIGLLGVFRFRRADGSFADYEEVLRWTAAHSRLPDFSFWDTRVERGTLCAVTVDGVEQGRVAGRMARRIVVDGVRPRDIAPEPSTKGRPMISLARARALGLQVRAGVLLDAVVLPRFAWQA